MAGVGGGDGEASGDGGLRAGELCACGFGYGAVEASPALLEVLGGPGVGQGDREFDAVGFAIGTGAFVDGTADAAMSRENGACRCSAASAGGLPCGNVFGSGDFQRRAGDLNCANWAHLSVFWAKTDTVAAANRAKVLVHGSHSIIWELFRQLFTNLLMGGCVISRQEERSP